MQYAPGGPISELRHRMGAMAQFGIGINPDSAILGKMAEVGLGCLPLNPRRILHRNHICDAISGLEAIPKRFFRHRPRHIAAWLQRISEEILIVVAAALCAVMLLG